MSTQNYAVSIPKPENSAGHLGFQQQSFIRHEKENQLHNGELSDHQKSWFLTDTIGYWRMMRPFRVLESYIKANKGTNWITIGDGRFGYDSITLNKLEPSLKLIPTDLSTDQLEYAKSKKWIADYKKVNAEEIPFTDNNFDFAFCKESYHHFPSPYRALYEMLRVSKKSVILIEPNDKKDIPLTLALVQRFKNFLKRAMGKKIPSIDTWNFESVGNYIYSLSVRETEKLCLGLNLPGFAYYYYNDYYEKGIENTRINKASKLWQRVQSRLKKADRRCKMGMGAYTSVMIVIFKTRPSETEIQALKSSGFIIPELPANPYI